MRSKFRVALFAIPALLGITAYIFLGTRCAAAPHPAADNPAKEKVILDIMMKVLNGAHYDPQDIDDAFSHNVYDTYLKRADFNKKILLQSDMDELKTSYYDKIDDQINALSFDFFNSSSDIFVKRIAEDKQYYTDILATAFDFTIKESVELDPDKLPYAKDQTEMKESWRKFLKYQVMVRFVDAKNAQDKELKDPKTIDASNESYVLVTDSAGQKVKTKKKIKTDSELEADARAKVKKTEDDIFTRLGKVNRADRMDSYLNVISGIFDPHTEFFPPADKESFDIAMSGQLEGIGATLQEKDGYIKVTSIVTGSPCWKQGQLKVGDLIMKAGQGDKEPVDLAGMQVDDAIKLIRGKKGTEVRLTVKKPDGNVIVIPIVRDIIILDETFAQSAIIDQQKKIGYIRLPGFYADFTKDKSGTHTSSKDVEKELEKLKAEKVTGIILDLRDNGGGSLYEVIKMVGLFIPQGPVVQVKTRSKGVSVYDDEDKGDVVYDGPLVVLINENSASASEILAAAIQDYKRGIIVGSSASTWGKGTVQNFVDFDGHPTAETTPDMSPLGQLKVTIQKFYRINGGSTQLKGVIPDIQLPGYYKYDEQGEKEMDFPLPWDQIPAAPYTTWKKSPNYDRIKSASNDRVAKNESFILINAKAEQFKREKENTIESLYLPDYKGSLDAMKEENLKFKPLENPIAGLNTIILGVDYKTLQSDTAKLARKNDFLDKLKKDPYVNEASLIIKDWK